MTREDVLREISRRSNTSKEDMSKFSDKELEMLLEDPTAVRIPGGGWAESQQHYLGQE